MEIFVVLTFLFCSYVGLGSETCETELGFVFAADDPRLASCKGASCDGLGDAKDCPCKDLCCGENTFMWSLPGKRRFGQWGRCVSSSCVPHGGNELDGWGYCCPGLVPRNVGSWTRCVNSGCAASGSRDNDYIEGCCVGTYPDNGQCKTCPAGHSCPGFAKLSVPLDCPPGSEAAFDHSSCQLCEPGHYKLHADNGCQPCAPGTYSAVAGASVCLPCNAIGSYFNDETGSSDCVCREGFSGPGCDYVETPSSGKLTVLELWEECIASEPSLSCSNSSLAFQLGCLSLRPRDGFAEMAAPIALNALNCLNDAFDRELVSSFLAQLRDALPEDLWQFNSLAPKRTTTAQPTIVSVDLGGKPVSVCSVHVETKHGRRVPLLSSSPLESDGCTAPASKGWTGSVELWDGEQVAAVVFDKHPSSSDSLLLGASVAVDGVAFGTVTDSPVQASVRVAGPALVNPADIDWVIVFDQSKACNVLTDLDRVRGAGATDALAQDTGFQQPIFRIKDGKDLSFIYKRLTPLHSKVSLRKNMLYTWSTQEGNQQGVDFELFASLEDALAEVNPVSPLDCITEIPGFGFPGNCSQGFAQLSCDSTSSVKSVEVAVVQNRRPLAEHDLATAALSAILPALEMLQLFGPTMSTYMGGPVDRSREGIVAKIKSTQFINGKHPCHIIPCVLGKCGSKGFQHSGSPDEVELGLAFARCTLIPDGMYNLVSIAPKYAMLNLAASVVFEVEDRPTGLTAMEEVRAVIQRVSAPSVDLPLRLANGFFTAYGDPREGLRSLTTIPLSTVEMGSDSVEIWLYKVNQIVNGDFLKSISLVSSNVNKKLDELLEDMKDVKVALEFISEQIMNGSKNILEGNRRGADFVKLKANEGRRATQKQREFQLERIRTSLSKLTGQGGDVTFLLSSLDSFGHHLEKALGFRTSLAEGRLGAEGKFLAKTISGPLRISLSLTEQVGSTSSNSQHTERDVVASEPCPSIESLIIELDTLLQSFGANVSETDMELHAVRFHDVLSTCGCSTGKSLRTARKGALEGVALALSHTKVNQLQQSISDALAKCTDTQSSLEHALQPWSAQIVQGRSAYRLADALKLLMEGTLLPKVAVSPQIGNSEEQPDPLLALLDKSRQRAMELASSMASQIAEINNRFLLLETGLLVVKNQEDGSLADFDFDSVFEGLETEILGMLFEAKVCSPTTLDIQAKGAMVNRASFNNAVQESSFRSALEGKTNLKEVTDVSDSQRGAFIESVNQVWGVCHDIVFSLSQVRRNAVNAQVAMREMVKLERELILQSRAAERVDAIIKTQEAALASLSNTYLKTLLDTTETRETAILTSKQLSDFLLHMNSVETTFTAAVGSKAAFQPLCQAVMYVSPEVLLLSDSKLKKMCTEELRVSFNEAVNPPFEGLKATLDGVFDELGSLEDRLKSLFDRNGREPAIHFIDITRLVDLPTLKLNNFSAIRVSIRESDFPFWVDGIVEVGTIGIALMDRNFRLLGGTTKVTSKPTSPLRKALKCNGVKETFQVGEHTFSQDIKVVFQEQLDKCPVHFPEIFAYAVDPSKTGAAAEKILCAMQVNTIPSSGYNLVLPSLSATWEFKVEAENPQDLQNTARIAVFFNYRQRYSCVNLAPPRPTDESGESSSLGAGTIAGIVVGTSVALGVVVAAMVVHRRRQRMLREELPTRTLVATSFKGVLSGNPAHNVGADSDDHS